MSLLIRLDVNLFRSEREIGHIGSKEEEGEEGEGRGLVMAGAGPIAERSRDRSC